MYPRDLAVPRTCGRSNEFSRRRVSCTKNRGRRQDLRIGPREDMEAPLQMRCSFSCRRSSRLRLPDRPQPHRAQSALTRLAVAGRHHPGVDTGRAFAAGRLAVPHAVRAEGITVAPGWRGRNPGTETRVTRRGVDANDPLSRATGSHSSGAGPGGVTGASRRPAKAPPGARRRLTARPTDCPRPAYPDERHRVHHAFLAFHQLLTNDATVRVAVRRVYAGHRLRAGGLGDRARPAGEPVSVPTTHSPTER